MALAAYDGYRRGYVSFAHFLLYLCLPYDILNYIFRVTVTTDPSWKSSQQFDSNIPQTFHLFTGEFIVTSNTLAVYSVGVGKIYATIHHCIQVFKILLNTLYL